MVEPIGVGLVGSGPWAAGVLAPMLAKGPETRLVGVWGRNDSAVADLAARWNAASYESFDELVGSCEAVAFCVPPAVQAALAPRAAQAGRPVILNKPVAESVAGAEQVYRAISEAGIPSVLALPWHLHPTVDRFIADCQDAEVTGCRATFVSGALLTGPFRTPWRLRRGVTLDIGPHIFDLLERCSGTIQYVQAIGDPHRAVALMTEHATGSVGSTLLSVHTGVRAWEAELRAYGTQGTVSLDCTELDTATSMDHVRHFFAAAVLDGTPTLGMDAAYGLRIQRIIDATERSLGGNGVKVPVDSA